MTVIRFGDIVGQVFHGMAIKKFMEDKMSEEIELRETIGKMRKDFKWERIFYIAMVILICLICGWFAASEMSRSADKQILIDSQQRTLDSQDTIIHIQHGIISDFAVEKNGALDKAAEYHAKWMEAIK